MSIFTKNSFTVISLAIALSLSGCQKAEQASSTSVSQPASTAHQDMQGMNHDKMNHEQMAGMNHNHMNHMDMPPASTPDPANSESVYLTNGKWHDQNNKPFDLNSLKGKKQVVAFIYTSCQAVCPIMMKTMKDMQDKLHADTKAKTEFLVISLDPKRDTPQVLAKFGEHYKTDDKWHFLSGSDDDIRLLANTMNIRYQFAEGGMINHSNVISVLDEQGKMIEQAIGNSQGEDKIVSALQQPAV